MKIIQILTALALLIISSYSLAACDGPSNLMPNCDFNSDISGYTASRGFVSHDAVEGYNSMGSYECTGQPAGAWIWCQVQTACLAIDPSTSYGVGFRVNMTNLNTVVAGSYPPFAEVRYTEYNDAACTANTTSQSVAAGSGLQLSSTNTWFHSQGTLTSTSLSNYIIVEMRALQQTCNNIDDCGITVNFDKAFFGQGLLPVELQSYSVE